MASIGLRIDQAKLCPISSSSTWRPDRELWCSSRSWRRTARFPKVGDRRCWRSRGCTYFAGSDRIRLGLSGSRWPAFKKTFGASPGIRSLVHGGAGPCRRATREDFPHQEPDLRPDPGIDVESILIREPCRRSRSPNPCPTGRGSSPARARFRSTTAAGENLEELRTLLDEQAKELYVLRMRLEGERRGSGSGARRDHRAGQERPTAGSAPSSRGSTGSTAVSSSASASSRGRSSPVAIFAGRAPSPAVLKKE